MQWTNVNFYFFLVQDNTWQSAWRDVSGRSGRGGKIQKALPQRIGYAFQVTYKHARIPEVAQISTESFCTLLGHFWRKENNRLAFCDFYISSDLLSAVFIPFCTHGTSNNWIAVGLFSGFRQVHALNTWISSSLYFELQSIYEKYG